MTHVEGPHVEGLCTSLPLDFEAYVALALCVQESKVLVR